MMVITLIEKVYSFLWGDLFQIPLPGGGSVGISLLIILLIPTGIYFTKRSRGLLHCLYLRRAAGPAHRKQLGPTVHKSRGWTIYFSGAFTGHPSAPDRSSVLFCAGSFARIHGHIIFH